MGNRKKAKNRSNFIMQGSILAAASILSRLIGMLYRLPVTNIITDHGNDYYSAAYEIYNIILLISSYSLPLAVSKLISAKAALGQYRNARRIFQGALYMALAVGLLGSIVTYLGAGFFTGKLLNTPESELSLKILALAVFFLAVMGVLRGFFQGMGSMMPTAVSDPSGAVIFHGPEVSGSGSHVPVMSALSATRSASQRESDGAFSATSVAAS